MKRNNWVYICCLDDIWGEYYAYGFEHRVQDISYDGKWRFNGIEYKPIYSDIGMRRLLNLSNDMTKGEYIELKVSKPHSVSKSSR